MVRVAGPGADVGFAAKVVEVRGRAGAIQQCRIGSSVRGAIDLVLLAGELGQDYAAPGPTTTAPASTPRWPR